MVKSERPTVQGTISTVLTPRPARLAQSVIEPILEQIIRGDLAVGSGLPREVDLERLFGVSRTVIREAVKSLEQKGVVRARQGFGTTVSPVDEWNLLDPDVLALSVTYDRDLELQGQLVEVRVALEGLMAAEAAERATEEDLADLERAVRDMGEELTDPAAYLESDFNYHIEIMRISGNRLARNIVQTVHVQVRNSLADTRATPAELQQTHREHATILEGLRRDPEAAKVAMMRHISDSWSRRAERTGRQSNKKANKQSNKLR